MTGVGSGTRGFTAGGGLARLALGAAPSYQPPKSRLALIEGRIRDRDRRRRVRKAEGSKFYRRAHEKFRQVGIRTPFVFPKSKPLNRPLLNNNQKLNSTLSIINQLVNNQFLRPCPRRVRQTASLVLGSGAPCWLREIFFPGDRARLKKCLRGGTPQTARPHPGVHPSVRGLGQNPKSVSRRKIFLQGMGLGVVHHEARRRRDDG